MTGVQSSRHTRDRLYLTQQVIGSRQVFPARLWRGTRTSGVSQHLALGAHAALGEIPCEAGRGKTSVDPPSWLRKETEVVTCTQIMALHTLSRARGENEPAQ